MNKLNTGALKIEEDKLVEDKVKMDEFEMKEVDRLAKEAVRQVEDEKFRLEQEEHMARLRDNDDLDEIQDEYTDKDLIIENEEEMTEK